LNTLPSPVAYSPTSTGHGELTPSLPGSQLHSTLRRGTRLRWTLVRGTRTQLAPHSPGSPLEKFPESSHKDSPESSLESSLGDGDKNAAGGWMKRGRAPCSVRDVRIIQLSSLPRTSVETRLILVLWDPCFTTLFILFSVDWLMKWMMSNRKLPISVGFQK
jgi:hypothetical protein